MENIAEIGIIGGSGFYSFLENMKEMKVETPYGAPSDLVATGEIEGRKVAFLPRHGKLHTLPPHMINYRANIWALNSLGVKRIIAPCAVGALQSRYKIGDLVICDQFVDRTRGRKDTYYDGPRAVHVSSADMFCSHMMQLTYDRAKEMDLQIHRGGTAVIIQGPRFSSKAESRWFTSMGWDVVNMTAYPECILAAELALCYMNISLITDYDAGLIGAEGVQPVSAAEVIRAFGKGVDNMKKLIKTVIPLIGKKRTCKCPHSLDEAVVS
ncbi:MAG: S-methyl-5'-thioadenosine phosphorylase [Chloroflexi bacterium]|nr:S-methyl-5'-thioadenosine phosphorylase [Chloroflexota bacterium]